MRPRARSRSTSASTRRSPKVFDQERRRSQGSASRPPWLRKSCVSSLDMPELAELGTEVRLAVPLPLRLLQSRRCEVLADEQPDRRGLLQRACRRLLEEKPDGLVGELVADPLKRI